MFFYQYERKGWLTLVLLTVGLIVLPRHFSQRDHDFFILCEAILPEPDSLVIRPEPLDLNEADSLSLVKLKGIGPYYAHKIIKYRERLGGFTSASQLKEVNMTYFNVDSNLHLFAVKPGAIRKKDLNTMEFRDVLRHPYLEYEEVKLIFNARRKYRNVSFDTLRKYQTFPPDKLQKIKPYFR